MIKFLYFRAEATIGNDDASGDSVCYPVSSLMGMEPTGDEELTLYFKQLSNQFSDSEDADDDEGLTDIVKLTVGTNAHKAAMKNIVDVIAYGNEAFIVIGDDLSSDTEYISGITAVVSITVRGVNN
tara:strand:- start:510 stop:887 length:378 start_codon:yes stop_codon:yes gene_type:complete